MSDGFPIARLGFFVCFIGLLATGYYAYSLQSSLAAARAEAARTVSDRDTLKTRLTSIEQENAAGVKALEGCRQTLGVTQEKLDDALKARPARRRG